jgi:hypothetical protein
MVFDLVEALNVIGAPQPASSILKGVGALPGWLGAAACILFPEPS